jgi:hypothetical protein
LFGSTPGKLNRRRLSRNALIAMISNDHCTFFSPYVAPAPGTSLFGSTPGKLNRRRLSRNALIAMISNDHCTFFLTICSSSSWDKSIRKYTWLAQSPWTIV